MGSIPVSSIIVKVFVNLIDSTLKVQPCEARIVKVFDNIFVNPKLHLPRLVGGGREFRMSVAFFNMIQSNHGKPCKTSGI